MKAVLLQVPEHEKRAQQSVVGAVRVACRALGAGGGLRRPMQHQRRASMDVPLRRISDDWDQLMLRCATFIQPGGVQEVTDCTCLGPQALCMQCHGCTALRLMPA